MVLDSNIIIAYLVGDKEVIKHLNYWKLEEKLFFIPAIVETEILSFPKMTVKEIEMTTKFLETFIFISLDRATSRLAAKLRREYSIKLADASIAATAIFLEVPLVTRNKRDFKKIEELNIISI